ncbi:NADH-quinone oxidoreductase subunit C [Pinisolibacter aquiterrae]|uniref:NADH-quinone oxidoreductase subunit C n=1 Tax=Pinisolibacter aquiterrae TaxID=2815579 RepID=UPI001C3E14C1|nr:NADH-quinone oxidoreductase subunit C [Pinisolibacter aquiterrae]MCC8235061.1 NADH-quinone oxidoreductase subunit C [Pinisolibacter aquiterrae]
MTHTDLLARLADLPGVERVADGANGIRADAPFLDVDALADALPALGLRLGTITGIPLGPDGETAIIYHFVAHDRIVDVATVTRNNAIASLAPRLRPASWAEREIHDLFDVDFLGHPNLAPLMRPEGYATGMMRAPMCAARRPAPPSNPE